MGSEHQQSGFSCVARFKADFFIDIKSDPSYSRRASEILTKWGFVAAYFEALPPFSVKVFPQIKLR